jgi:RND family efflux transporter MFP subunit
MSASRSDRLLRFAAWMLPVLLLASCSGGEEPELPPVVRPVKTLVIGGETEGELNFPGTVQGADRSVLAFRVAGQLIELPVNEGDEVSRGRLLARLDPTDFEIAVAEAKAAFDKSVADHRRYQRLYEREAVPLADVEFYRAQREVANARYDQAKADLGYTHLKAPYSGYVGRKYAENFEDVQAKQQILTLQNVSEVEIVVDIPENFMARFDVSNMKIQVFAEFDALPGSAFPLELKESAAEADAATRTYRVTFSMPQPEEILLLPGMTARVKVRGVVEGKTTAFRVPAVAVFAGDGGEPLMWIVDPQTMTVQRRVVQLGEVTGERDVWVSSGLNEGETIAVTAVQELVEGDEIRALPKTY